MPIQHKKQIILLVLLCGLVCLTTTLNAQCPTNNPSDLPNIIKQSVEAASTVKTTQNTFTEDEKQRTAVNGNANCSASPNNTQGENEIKTTVYDYLKENVFKESKSNIIKQQENYEAAIQEIKKTFFIQGGKKSTPSNGTADNISTTVNGASSKAIDSVLQKRTEYVNDVSANSLKYSIDLREKVKEDIQSVANAQTKGCNQLQGYLLQNRNLQALIKATASDIIIQILTMEATASQNLLKEPPNLIELKDEPNITRGS